MGDPVPYAALDGAAQDLRDAIASTAMLGVSQRCREDLREHADAAIALHRREIDAQHRLVEGLQYRLKLAHEERDRMSERLQAALDERDDAEAAHATAEAKLIAACRGADLLRVRAEAAEAANSLMVDDNDGGALLIEQLRGQLSRALDLLARLRPGEPRSWPALCQFQDEIDTLMAECRGEKP